jgi:hypothetical protein
MKVTKRAMASAVCAALVIAGCQAPEHVKSTFTLLRQAHVRVATTDPAAQQCVAACVPSSGNFGDCLARCPWPIVEPGRCASPGAGSGEVCGNRLLQWTEERDSHCKDGYGDPDTEVISCKETVTYGENPTLKIVGGIALGIILLPVLIVASACSGPGTCIH